jgi:predicted O-linked N-acetylglucosamine transferase (SPINDLY family)
LPTYFYRPPESAAIKPREAFGLSAKRRLYFCAQNPCKLHPQFDRTLAGILRRDPGGEVLLTDGKHPHLREALLNRFRRTMPDCVGRIRFLPRQDGPEFLNVMRVADVLLDTIHCGGGNTTYEALAMGVPVVTCPSNMLRGRVTYACYKQMGVLDCVASDEDDYAHKAVQLATDRDYREAIRTKILQANAALFEDLAAVRELERFFAAAIDRARSSSAA